MTQATEFLDNLDGFLCALLAQQADAEPDGRQTILFRRSKTGIEAIDHAAEILAPAAPVGRVDDDIGIAGAGIAQPFAEGVCGLCQLLARAAKPADEIEEAQKVGKPFEFQQIRFGPRQGNIVFGRQADDRRGLEAAFEMDVNFCLGQSPEVQGHACFRYNDLLPEPEDFIAMQEEQELICACTVRRNATLSAARRPGLAGGSTAGFHRRGRS
jgi:hypothetical protein